VRPAFVDESGPGGPSRLSMAGDASWGRTHLQGIKRETALPVKWRGLRWMFPV